MKRAVSSRLARLETSTSGTGQIPVFCDTDHEVPAVVDDMIAAGRIAERDRVRCVRWERVTSPAPGWTHDDWICGTGAYAMAGAR